MPAQSEKIFWLENENNFQNFREKCLETDRLIESIPLSCEETEVLEKLVGLGNFVRRGESESFLKLKRQLNPGVFENMNLFHSTMTYLSVYSFKLPTRKIIHKLFDKISKKQNRVNDLDEFDHI